MPVTGPIVDAIALKPLQESKATSTPEQSHLLSTDQQFVVLGNRPLKVEANYQAAQNGKYGVKFLDETDIGDQGYIYAPHFEEIPQVLHAKRSIKLVHGDAEFTLYKGSHVIVEDVENGTPYATLHFRHAVEGINEWQIYCKDLEDGCELIGTARDNKPDDEPVTNFNRDKRDRGPAISIPGLSNPIYLYDPIDAELAPDFYWYEALHNGDRIPENADVTHKIIRIARVLQQVRDLLGSAIQINSWYRPPHVNRAVGGARYSRHLNGDAVDFEVIGWHAYDVYDRLNNWWGSQGGLASSSIFTHIDGRGYYARWSYGY